MNLESLRDYCILLIIAFIPFNLLAKENIVLSTNWLAQAEHGGFYQAVANGIYEKYGLVVTIRQGGPGINSKALLLADKVDFNIGGSAGALNFVASDVPFKAVAAIFFSKRSSSFNFSPRSGK